MRNINEARALVAREERGLSARYWRALYRWDDDFTRLTERGVRRFNAITSAVSIASESVTEDELPGFLRTGPRRIVARVVGDLVVWDGPWRSGDTLVVPKL